MRNGFVRLAHDVDMLTYNTVNFVKTIFTSINKTRTGKMEGLQTMLRNLVWLKGDWCYPSCSKETDYLLRQCVNITPTPDVPEDVDIVQEVMENSDKFPVPFPIENVRLKKLKELVPDSDQTKHISSTYPLIHERVLLLMASFIVHVREFGTPIEKALYKDMTIPNLVDRLLLKRAVTFCGPRDLYKLLSGEEGQDGWETVGTMYEKSPLVLANCLSYSEMRLAAMLYVSGHTSYINDGRRRNEGCVDAERTPEGVVIGLIGTRLQRKFLMEYQEMLITEQQNRPERGYGEEVSPRTCLDVLRTAYVRDGGADKCAERQTWCEFYQVPSYTYEEILPRLQKPSSRHDYEERFVFRPNSTDIFDNEVYYKRISIPFDCALLEADSRGAGEGKMAYLYLVGIGLGVWKVSAHQTDVFILTFLDRLRSMLAKGLLSNVAHVNFAYMHPSENVLKIFTDYPQILSPKHPLGGIGIELSTKQPSSPLEGENRERLLVTTYAWDGNAHPGNEFWMGSLSSSGDPAAACSTQVAELHNAHINTRYCRASNLRVAGAHGLLPLADYCRLLLADR